MTAQELLFQVMPRMKETDGAAFYDIVNATLTIINNRLWDCKSSLIVSTKSLTVTKAVDSVALPVDYLGILEDPFIRTTERSLQLRPLPEYVRLSLPQNGSPAYYLIEPTVIRLYPTPDIAGTLIMRQFCKVPVIEDGADVIPYDGNFDTIIRDAVVRAAALGTFATATPEFRAMIVTQVDAFIRLRNPPSISWAHPPTGRQWLGSW